MHMIFAVKVIGSGRCSSVTRQAWSLSQLFKAGVKVSKIFVFCCKRSHSDHKSMKLSRWLAKVKKVRPPTTKHPIELIKTSIVFWWERLNCWSMSLNLGMKSFNRLSRLTGGMMNLILTPNLRKGPLLKPIYRLKKVKWKKDLNFDLNQFTI
jgi:hypothetical protein